MILAIRTDKPESEISIHDQDGQIIDGVKWLAHKELSVTILEKITSLLSVNNYDAQDISAVIVYSGPGSFTGLRIGVTVANTFAYSLGVSVIGGIGESWLEEGFNKLSSAKPGDFVVPHYGGEANITKPRK